MTRRVSATRRPTARIPVSSPCELIVMSKDTPDRRAANIPLDLQPTASPVDQAHQWRTHPACGVVRQLSLGQALRHWHGDGIWSGSRRRPYFWRPYLLIAQTADRMTHVASFPPIAPANPPTPVGTPIVPGAIDAHGLLTPEALAFVSQLARRFTDGV